MAKLTAALTRRLTSPLTRFANSNASTEGVGASAFASSAAPSGYHWEFVTSNGDQVNSGGIPVVDLVRN